MEYTADSFPAWKEIKEYWTGSIIWSEAIRRLGGFQAKQLQVGNIYMYIGDTVISAAGDPPSIKIISYDSRKYIYKITSMDSEDYAMGYDINTDISQKKSYPIAYSSWWIPYSVSQRIEIGL